MSGSDMERVSLSMRTLGNNKEMPGGYKNELTAADANASASAEQAVHGKSRYMTTLEIAK
jgi:hypothetical protein